MGMMNVATGLDEFSSQAAVEQLYAVLAPAVYGELFLYASLNEIAGIDCRERRYVVYAVMRRLQKTAQRTLVAVRNQGYRIAYPKEHLGLAHGQQQKARRSVGRAQAVVRSTNRRELTQDENVRLDQMEVRLAWQEEALARVSAKQQRFEGAQLQMNTEIQAQLLALAEEVRALTDAKG